MLNAALSSKREIEARVRRPLVDFVDMHGHRRVAIAGGRPAAKALVKALPAEIVDEEAVGQCARSPTQATPA